MFATLPTAVLARIVAFADGDFVSELYPAAPQLPVELLTTLLHTGDAGLRRASEELQCEFLASVVCFTFSAVDMNCGGQSTETRLVECLDHAGAGVRCLAIGLEILAYHRKYEVVKAREWAESFDRVRIDWHRVFALCPQLRRLDLSGLPLHSTHLPALLRAAAAHCRHVKSLVLPDKEWYRGSVAMDVDRTLQTLYDALQRWHRHNGGLQQLTVPHRTTHPDDTTTRRSLADEFLLAVASSCPQLEHFDGWKVTLRETDGILRCDERIHCSLEVWQLFCRLCPKIQEIHWCVFPLEDAYFEAFAAEPRSHLKKLTLATNASTSRVRTDGSDETQRVCALSSVFQAIAACPALEHLSVVLQEEFCEPSQLAIKSIISDELIKTLVGSCPGLRQLDILQTHTIGAGMCSHLTDPREGITDEGLSLLASLPELRTIRMTVGSHCGAQGLVALVTSSSRIGPARELELLVGSYNARSLLDSAASLPRRNCIQFHAVLLEFLELLIVHSDALEGRHFKLTIHNGSTRYLDNEAKWEDQLETLASQLAIHCPSVQLRILRQGGIVGATLVQTRHAVGSILGVRSNECRHRRKEDSSVLDWTKYAWYATMQALTLTAAFSVRASARRLT